jgi:E3 ubiquitin-protein ligase TRIP12
MIKAKAKAERAAARQTVANAAGVPVPAQASVAAGSSTPAEDSPAPEPAADAPQAAADADEIPAVVPAREPVLDRTELLRSKPGVVGRYMQLMVPILVDVYAASVVAPIRLKTLTGLLKAISFLDADELRRVFTVSIILQTLCVFVVDVCSSLFRSLALPRLFYPLRIIHLWSLRLFSSSNS